MFLGIFSDIMYNVWIFILNLFNWFLLTCIKTYLHSCKKLTIHLLFIEITELTDSSIIIFAINVYSYLSRKKQKKYIKV